MIEELTEEERRLIEGLTTLKLFATCSFVIIFCIVGVFTCVYA